jgi:hypothetical protein
VVARTQILEDSGAADSENEGGALFASPTKAAPAGALVDPSPPDERSARAEQSLQDLLRSGSRRRVAAAVIALLALGGVFAARLRASHRRAFVAPAAARSAPTYVRALSPVRPLPPRRQAPVAASTVSQESNNVPALPRIVPPVSHPRARRRDRAALERTLPNIDQAGIGIPSE